jgi:hypothetical protein
MPADQRQVMDPVATTRRVVLSDLSAKNVGVRKAKP